MSYVYVGWMMMDDTNMFAGLSTHAWINAVLPISNPAKNRWRDSSLNVALFGYAGWGNAGGNVMNRLSAGVDRFLITDINTIFTGDEMGSSVVPVMWDQLSTTVSEFSHVPAGQNALCIWTVMWTSSDTMEPIRRSRRRRCMLPSTEAITQNPSLGVINRTDYFANCFC